MCFPSTKKNEVKMKKLNGQSPNEKLKFTNLHQSILTKALKFVRCAIFNPQSNLNKRFSSRKFMHSG
jgi:hypothetical protein